jgi:hypothetical protein
VIPKPCYGGVLYLIFRPINASTKLICYTDRIYVAIITYKLYNATKETECA